MFENKRGGTRRKIRDERGKKYRGFQKGPQNQPDYISKNRKDKMKDIMDPKQILFLPKNLKDLNLGRAFLTGGQAKIAAKAPPPNKIDEKDFAVLRAEKAKGRGMGLQDEKVKPGKVQKAALGMLALGIGAKKLMDKNKKELPPGLGAAALLTKKKKEILGKRMGGVMKYKIGSGLDLPVISSVKPAVHTSKKAQKTAVMKEQFNKQKSRMGKKPYSSMTEMREAKGFKPGESASEFNKRRMALEVGKKALKATTVGKIALGVGAAGVAAQQYLKSKMNKKDEPKKKMGGGMMQKPMGYRSGGHYDEKNQNVVKHIRVKKKMGGGMMKKYSKGGGSDMGGKDRLTERDIDMAKKAISRVKAKRAQQGFLRTDPMPKKMGGGMMMQRPMGYKHGTSVTAKCKLGRNKPTKIT